MNKQLESLTPLSAGAFGAVPAYGTIFQQKERIMRPSSNRTDYQSRGENPPAAPYRRAADWRRASPIGWRSTNQSNKKAPATV